MPFSFTTNRGRCTFSSEEVRNTILFFSLLFFYHPHTLLTLDIVILLNYYHSGVDTDELDSNVEDWEEETIEFFISEEIIPLGDLE